MRARLSERRPRPPFVAIVAAVAIPFVFAMVACGGLLERESGDAADSGTSVSGPRPAGPGGSRPGTIPPESAGASSSGRPSIPVDPRPAPFETNRCPASTANLVRTVPTKDHVVAVLAARTDVAADATTATEPFDVFVVFPKVPPPEAWPSETIQFVPHPRTHVASSSTPFAVRLEAFAPGCTLETVGEFAGVTCSGLPGHDEYVLVSATLARSPLPGGGARVTAVDAVFAKGRAVDDVESWHVEVDDDAPCFRIPRAIVSGSP
ncbi:MAG: hypothetical protein U0169_01280 [Polyangiaceae bacterium]